MRFLSYLKARAVEMLLVFLVAFSLAGMTVWGFNIADEFATNLPLIASITLACIVVLFAFAFSKKTIIVGTFVLVIVVPVTLLVVSMAAYGGSMLDDDFANPTIFYLVVIATSVIVFLLSRRAAFCAFLFVAGAVTAAFLEFLYLRGLVGLEGLFLVGALVLFGYRLYERDCEVDSHMRFQIQAVMGPLTVAALACACAMALWGLVIAPHDPPAAELKLITRYYALETVHVNGTEEYIHQLNQDINSQNVDENTQDTSNTDDTNADDLKQAPQDPTSGQDAANGGAQGSSLTGSGQAFHFITYFSDPLVWPWIVLGVVLAIAIVIMSRKAMRRRRYHRIMDGSGRDRVLGMYLFLLERIQKMRLFDLGSRTPLEIADDIPTSLQRFERGPERKAPTSGFAELSRVYAKVAYGGIEPSDAEIRLFNTYYRSFYRRARYYIGRIRYLRWFFRL